MALAEWQLDMMVLGVAAKLVAVVAAPRTNQGILEFDEFAELEDRLGEARRS